MMLACIYLWLGTRAESTYPAVRRSTHVSISEWPMVRPFCAGDDAHMHRLLARQLPEQRARSRNLVGPNSTQRRAESCAFRRSSLTVRVRACVRARARACVRFWRSGCGGCSFHREGCVQGYQLVKTEDLPSLSKPGFEPQALPGRRLPPAPAATVPTPNRRAPWRKHARSHTGWAIRRGPSGMTGQGPGRA
jgi:hypothetical protein